MHYIVSQEKPTILLQNTIANHCIVSGKSNFIVSRISNFIVLKKNIAMHYIVSQEKPTILLQDTIAKHCIVLGKRCTRSTFCKKKLKWNFQTQQIRKALMSIQTFRRGVDQQKERWAPWITDHDIFEDAIRILQQLATSDPSVV